MFGTLNHPTPMAMILCAVWVVAQWRIAPPLTWIRRARVVVEIESAGEPQAFEPR